MAADLDTEVLGRCRLAASMIDVDNQSERWAIETRTVASNAPSADSGRALTVGVVEAGGRVGALFGGSVSGGERPTQLKMPL